MKSFGSTEERRSILLFLRVAEETGIPGVAVKCVEIGRNTGGEGGSGGALAIAVGDRVNMLENSVYSVISPEGCASILWRDSAKAEMAAEALKITARDLSQLGIIDEIVPEPEGGAHLDHEGSAALLDPVLDRSLRDLLALTPRALLEQRYEKFRRMGQFFESVQS